MAEKKTQGVLRRCFTTKRHNPAGRYTCRLFDGLARKWVHVHVDDQFPCYKVNGQPVYAKPRGDELWVLLLEKCYAKLHGSYKAIEAGCPAEGMMDLTGAPGAYIGFADEHPALAASGAAAYQAAEDAETADAEKGRGAAETPAPAGLQGAAGELSRDSTAQSGQVSQCGFHRGDDRPATVEV